MANSRTILLIIIILIVVVGLYLFVLPFLGLASSASQPPPSPSITVLEHSGEIDSHSGTYIVRGTAKNTGTLPVVKVYIVVTTYDSTGGELGSTYDALLNMNPGDESQFRVETRPYNRGIQVARYNIVPNYNPVPGL